MIKQIYGQRKVIKHIQHDKNYEKELFITVVVFQLLELYSSKKILLLNGFFNNSLS